MIDVDSVRSRLAAVANGEMLLEEFEEWIEPASWNMHADSSSEAIELVSSIHLLMSERDHGDIDQARFRHDLLMLLGDLIVVDIALGNNEAPSIRRLPGISRYAANAEGVEVSPAAGAKIFQVRDVRSSANAQSLLLRVPA